MAEVPDSVAEPEATLVGPDLVLLLLAAPGRTAEDEGRVNGITRLEKLIYLATKETDAAKAVEQPFVFKPYDYGPYSKEIYEAIDILENVGLVKEERSFAGRTLSEDEMEDWTSSLDEREGVERRFYLTPQGKDVSALLSSRHRAVAAALSSIKLTYGSASLKRLIRYVYETYPDDATASKILDRVLS